MYIFFFFFFSSRRRHTRYIGDWSSDVCSSDLLGRRSLVAGSRDWQQGVQPELRVATEVLDTEGAENLGLEAGALTIVFVVGAGDLGRLAIAAHRERLQ